MKSSSLNQNSEARMASQRNHVQQENGHLNVRNLPRALFGAVFFTNSTRMFQATEMRLISEGVVALAGPSKGRCSS